MQDEGVLQKPADNGFNQNIATILSNKLPIRRVDKKILTIINKCTQDWLAIRESSNSSSISMLYRVWLSSLNQQDLISTWMYLTGMSPLLAFFFFPSFNKQC